MVLFRMAWFLTFPLWLSLFVYSGDWWYLLATLYVLHFSLRIE